MCTREFSRYGTGSDRKPVGSAVTKSASHFGGGGGDGGLATVGSERRRRSRRLVILGTAVPACTQLYSRTQLQPAVLHDRATCRLSSLDCVVMLLLLCIFKKVL